jgi:hypothetical protein
MIKRRNSWDAVPGAGDELIRFTEEDRQVLHDAAKELKKVGGTDEDTGPRPSQLAGRLDGLAGRVPAGVYPGDDDW